MSFHFFPAINIKEMCSTKWTTNTETNSVTLKKSLKNAELQFLIYRKKES